MSNQPSRLKVQSDSEIDHIEFLDRNILEESIIQAIGDEICLIIEQKATPKLLINFSNVEHLSSAALGTLITVNNKVKQKAGQLRFCCIDENILEIFVMTKLDRLFKIHTDIEQATNSFSK